MENKNGLRASCVSDHKKAWIVSVNMGYGHQRTTHPLKHLSPAGEVIHANDYGDIPDRDRSIWESSRSFYEAISQFKRIPIIGDLAFGLFDKFQKILTFYPRRDLSKPNLTLKTNFRMIGSGWGKHLVEKLSFGQDKQNPLPLVTSFFTPAFMAEHFGYPGEIYCIICDADISRSWVSLDGKKSRIKYLVPNHRVADRLELYGVRKENIHLTGYPLPKANIGTIEMETLKDDIRSRLCNLDPNGIYRERYMPMIEKYLGNCEAKADHPLTLMFSIGGAGAQKEIAMKMVKSFLSRIKKREMRVLLMAGIRPEVGKYFKEGIESLGLSRHVGQNIEIICEGKIEDYFDKFNELLRTTDILWTKPSELSFYVGLGIPIIMAPTIGSQETFNRDWLLRHGAGIIQEKPEYANEWLFDFLGSGLFANAAMKGFVETESCGTFNIEKILSEGK